MADINNPIMRYLYYKGAASKSPVSGTFELTPCCNMNCRMCYVRMSREEQRATGRRELKADEWVALAREAKEEGMVSLLLTGGEPFLREDLEEILAKTQGMGLLIQMNTNATLITEKNIKWIKEHAPTRVNVTLYGGSDATYERLCRNSEGYTQALRGIRLLRDAGIHVGINMSLTPYNEQDIDAIFSKVQELGLSARPTAYMFPPVRKSEGASVEADSRFSPEHAGKIQLYTDYLRLGKEAYEKRLQMLHDKISVLDSEDECMRDSNQPIKCMAGACAFWVTWDGRMTPCGMMTGPAVNVSETGFRQGWQEIVSEIENAVIDNDCVSCEKRFFCTVCRALLLAETGGLKEKPEYLCRLTDAYLAEAEKQYSMLNNNTDL